MTKRLAIFEAVLLGGLPALMGITVNLLAIPLVGGLPFINKMSIAACLIIGVIGGMCVYNINKKFFNSDC